MMDTGFEKWTQHLFGETSLRTKQLLREKKLFYFRVPLLTHQNKLLTNGDLTWTQFELVTIRTSRDLN